MAFSPSVACHFRSPPPGPVIFTKLDSLLGCCLSAPAASLLSSSRCGIARPGFADLRRRPRRQSPLREHLYRLLDRYSGCSARLGDPGIGRQDRFLGSRIAFSSSTGCISCPGAPCNRGSGGRRSRAIQIDCAPGTRAAKYLYSPHIRMWVTMAMIASTRPRT